MPSIGVNLRVTGHCSQGGRKYMEDFFSVAYQQGLADQRDFEYAFIGIYDGHGGSEAATFAKEHLINLIVNQKAFWSDDDQAVLGAIREGYLATHYAMWREQEKWPKTSTGLPSTAGTTASVAFIRHGKIYIGHVGDSGIVLGYQMDGEKFWRARPLTEDHKPESTAERTRIMNSGGKVVNKAGVPRVVWNRPRIGHKGPVRRSTPIDEIPFLAVARSLGDLWSYNSALNKFVVSPEPDVRVVKIDPKRFKCLVFGTDGLWNVVNAQGAIDNVRQSDQMNEKSACIHECREWINPSKNLVDKALERWSTKKMRADNTSVVIIMFDPPGPPKRDILKSSSSKSQLLGYLPSDSDDSPPSQHLKIEPVQNFTMFDHSTNELMDIDGVPLPLPTSGATVLTRYDNLTANDVQRQNQHDAFTDPAMDCSVNADEDNYMSSFADSYNSLLNSSLNEDHSFYDHEAIDDSDFDDSNSYDSSNATHQYIDEPTYSLHRLQTRSEQQYDASTPIPSTSSAMYSDYPHNLVDHNYLDRRSTSYPSTSRGYIYNDFNANDDEVELDSDDDEDDDDNDDDEDATDNGKDDATTLFPLISSEYLIEPKTSANPNAITIRKYYSKELQLTNECRASTSKRGAVSNDLESGTMNNSRACDNSVQINEISSSDNDNAASSIALREVSTRLKKVPVNLKRSNNDALQPFIAERKVTRSSQLASRVRITRSAGIEKRVPISSPAVARNLKQKVAVIIQKRSPATTGANGKIHKENISILRKVPVKTLVHSAIVSPSRVRNGSIVPQPTDNKLLNQRTLRSQNALTKDNYAGKTIQRSTSNQSANVNTLIQQIGRAVAQAKGYAVSTRASSSIKTAANSINNSAKSLICKKPPKRLINSESVQMVKSISNRLSKPSTPTLRFKVVVAKKSVMEQLKSDARTSVITRRMRLQQ